MSEPKWTLEKIHKEVYDARTKMFVLSKVLETGSINVSEHPEWVLVIKPLLEDLMQNVEAVKKSVEASSE
jgi:hypothetical protein